MNSPSPSPSPSSYSPPLLFHHHRHRPLTSTDAAIIAASLALLALILTLIFFLYNKKNRNHHHHTSSIDPNDDTTISTIAILHHASSHPLIHIDSATDGFHPSLVVGKGQLGTVYRTTSSTGEYPFAVKRIHSHLVLSSNAGLQFSSKLKSLSFISHHPNVVPVLGYSEAPGERIIITELVGVKSLDTYLHDDGEKLGWAAALRIAAGAARGIEHLHDGAAPGIVHGRVKPRNVLVDSDFCARVCDYGLSFLDPAHYRRGLVGYLDGEGREEESKANDVYGLGVVVLEILCGRRSEGGLLVEWALPLIKVGRVEEVLDKRAGLPEDGVMAAALVRMAKVASACVGNGRRSRPVIGQVAAILSSLEREACGRQGMRRGAVGCERRLRGGRV